MMEKYRYELVTATIIYRINSQPLFSVLSLVEKYRRSEEVTTKLENHTVNSFAWSPFKPKYFLLISPLI